jgi:ribosome-associated protein
MPDPEITEAPRKLTLDQFLKIVGWVDSGGQAKVAIQAGLVQVNGLTDTRRRRQMAIGDRVEYQGQSAVVASLD